MASTPEDLKAEDIGTGAPEDWRIKAIARRMEYAERHGTDYPASAYPDLERKLARMNRDR